MKKLILILFTLQLYSSSLYSQLVPDFRVNDDTTSRPQTGAKIDTDSDGNFVIVWSDGREGINTTHIYAQVFEKSANPVGENFKINSNDTIRKPSLTVRSDGTFAVCWVAGNTTIPNRQRIKFKLFDRTGIPISQEIIVSDSLSNFEGDPVLDDDSNGRFVIAWEYYDKKIFFQRLDAFGNKIGGNVEVTDYPYNHTQRNPAITVRSDGSFIITWIDTRPPILPGGNNVFMQMFDSSGVPIGVNSIVNDSAAWDDQYFYPVISSDPVSGKFIIGFTYANVNQNYFYTRYQRYNKDGVKLGNNTGIIVASQSYITGVSINSEGKAVISYGISFFPLMQRIDSSGQNLGGPYIVTQTAFQTPIYSSGIKLSNDRIINVWSDQRNGNFDVYCNIRSFANPDSTVGITQVSSQVPAEFKLYQNYPNPFNPVTAIRFSVPNVKGETSNVKLIIYNSLGQEMKVLLNQVMDAGEYEYVFDGSRLSSGIYFYSLITENKILTKKMIITK
jgi:hypothetical protein